MKLILLTISLALSAITMAEKVKIDDGGLIAREEINGWYAMISMPLKHPILKKLSENFPEASQHIGFEKIDIQNEKYYVRVYLPGTDQYCEFSAKVSQQVDPRKYTPWTTYQVLHTFAKRLSHRSSELGEFCNQYDRLQTRGLIRFNLYPSSRDVLERTMRAGDDGEFSTQVVHKLFKVHSSGE